MAIAVAAGRTAMAASYATNFPNLSLHSADPGTAGNATSELSGGSPAYARKSAGWGTAAASAVSGSATFDVASGSTVAYLGVCVSATATTNDLRDRVALTSQSFASQGQYTVTPTYTQT